VYYSARLTNTSVSTLSANATAPLNYFINGTWNVFTVKSTVTIITNANGNITRVLRNQDISSQKAYGELTVTDNWNKFTLAIRGIDLLTGSVSHSMQRQMQFNAFKMTDDSVSNIVTRADIKAVAQAYGAMPGWGNYDTKMDFNGNFRVDIADISTVAANM
jgi:hypothetical protein